MNTFFAENINSNNSFELDEKESHHIFHVLRLQPGESIKITNGKGEIFLAEIVSVNKKKCSVKIISVQHFIPSPAKVHIAFSSIKSNDRLGFLLEKLTEIGVDIISPLFTQNSERRNINIEKEKLGLIAAIKQSGNPFLPKLNPVLSFLQFLDSVKSDNSVKYICHCRENNERLLSKIYRPGSNVIVCIGPEGDFTKKEIDTSLHNKFMPVSLGNTRLRTETAGVAAAVLLCSI